MAAEEARVRIYAFECGLAWSRPGGFEDLPGLRHRDGSDPWHDPPDRVTFPVAPLPGGGGVGEVLIHEAGHDGTFTFTKASTEMMTRAILGRLEIHPGWGVVAFGLVARHGVPMMLRSGAKIEGARETFLAVLSPGGEGEVTIGPPPPPAPGTQARRIAWKRFEGGSIRAGSPEGSVLPRVEGGVVFSRVDPGEGR